MHTTTTTNTRVALLVAVIVAVQFVPVGDELVTRPLSLIVIGGLAAPWLATRHVIVASVIASVILGAHQMSSGGLRVVAIMVSVMLLTTIGAVVVRSIRRTSLARN